MEYISLRLTLSYCYDGGGRLCPYGLFYETDFMQLVSSVYDQPKNERLIFISQNTTDTNTCTL
jgi:hypothetical protein